MPRSSTVCVDANLVVRLVTEYRDEAVWALWDEWDADGRRRVAPSLIRYELANSLYRVGRARSVAAAAVQTFLRTALSLGIDVIDDASLHASAVEIATRFSLPATYDAHYLALAERLGIEFHTGDRRLWNTVRHQLPWVQLVGTNAENSSDSTPR